MPLLPWVQRTPLLACLQSIVPCDWAAITSCARYHKLWQWRWWSSHEDGTAADADADADSAAAAGGGGYGDGDEDEDADHRP